ncbi:Uma2 family endonuclease [Streptomyces sp. NPDC086023]|uniref:Uma2 family endonuclease n=1 Tax=Streptomyces sp. NPDC086023 TaxID=3365746 RepID=UPI0037CFF80F
MTAVDDRRMTEFFESLQAPEGIKVELLRGEIVMMAGPDLVHNLIVEAIQDSIPRDRWLRLQTQDVDLLRESSEPQPDLVVVPREAAPGSGRLMPVEVVTLLVEVVSKTSRLRDYVTKRSLYAAGGVPAYLIVDPFEAKCTMLTEPFGSGEQAGYRAERTSKFGEPVPLAGLGLVLGTEEFGTLP